MELNLLNRKSLITKDKEQIVDLISPSMQYDDEVYNIIDFFFVGEDMIMRPDLLSLVTYSDVNNWDILLKFNGISNPFSIDQGDLIYVPDLAWLQNQVVDNSALSQDNYSLNNAVDPSKKLNIDKNKLEYDNFVKSLLSINKNAAINKELNTPNMAQPGQNEITIQNNEIYL